MSNVAGGTTSFNAPNYLGELFIMGEKKTPFLNMIGALSQGKGASAFQFPIMQDVALEAGSQPAVTENASLTAPTPTTFVRGQKTNTCQIFHKAVNVSYAKASQANLLTGLAVAGESVEPQDELDFQINLNMKQLSKDVDHTFINGVYQAAADADTAAKTRGILAAIETNVVDHGGVPAALAKAKIQALVLAMANSGAAFVEPVLFCGGVQKQRVTDRYSTEYRSDSREIGGVAIDTIVTDFGNVGVVWAPHMPASEIGIVDVAYCSPVFLPVPGKGYLFYETLAKSGASESGQIYGQIGLDHGPEQFHGKITELL